MSKWSFFDWLAYGSLWAAGIIEAAEAALLKAREIRRRLPRLLKNRNWAFVPLGLLILATIVLVLQWNGLIDNSNAHIATSIYTPPNKNNVKEAFDKIGTSKILGSPIGEFYSPDRVIYGRYANAIAIWFKEDNLYLLSGIYNSGWPRVLYYHELLPPNKYYCDESVADILNGTFD
ncbi:MAG TPA: hypothetical protein VMI30_03545 [Stellaceae bacterium]|nr:hypothetical protein [Stellaceae bacterium]